MSSFTVSYSYRGFLRTHLDPYLEGQLQVPDSLEGQLQVPDSQLTRMALEQLTLSSQRSASASFGLSSRASSFASEDAIIYADDLEDLREQAQVGLPRQEQREGRESYSEFLQVFYEFYPQGDSDLLRREYINYAAIKMLTPKMFRWAYGSEGQAHLFSVISLDKKEEVCQLVARALHQILEIDFAEGSPISFDEVLAKVNTVFDRLYEKALCHQVRECYRKIAHPRVSIDLQTESVCRAVCERGFAVNDEKIQELISRARKDLQVESLQKPLVMQDLVECYLLEQTVWSAQLRSLGISTTLPFFQALQNRLLEHCPSVEKVLDEYVKVLCQECQSRVSSKKATPDFVQRFPIKVLEQLKRDFPKEAVQNYPLLEKISYWTDCCIQEQMKEHCIYLVHNHYKYFLQQSRYPDVRQNNWPQIPIETIRAKVFAELQKKFPIQKFWALDPHQRSVCEEWLLPCFIDEYAFCLAEFQCQEIRELGLIENLEEGLIESIREYLSHQNHTLSSFAEEKIRRLVKRKLKEQEAKIPASSDSLIVPYMVDLFCRKFAQGQKDPSEEEIMGCFRAHFAKLQEVFARPEWPRVTPPELTPALEAQIRSVISLKCGQNTRKRPREN